MFQVSLTNFGTYFNDQFNSFEAAVEFAKGTGFESTIHEVGNGVAGTWSPINGASDWRNWK